MARIFHANVARKIVVEDYCKKLEEADFKCFIVLIYVNMTIITQIHFLSFTQFYIILKNEGNVPPR